MGSTFVLISCGKTFILSIHSGYLSVYSSEQTSKVFGILRLESVIIMNFLSVGRLDSLGTSSSISSLDISLDGVILDDSSCSSGSEDNLEDEGVHLEIEIEDGR